jgi:hypothetical protein
VLIRSYASQRFFNCVNSFRPRVFYGEINSPSNHGLISGFSGFVDASSTFLMRSSPSFPMYTGSDAFLLISGNVVETTALLAAKYSYSFRDLRLESVCLF